MLLQANQKLLFIGDSITDCGRGRPVGLRGSTGLGEGYVALVDNTLGACHPDAPVQVLNTGISGNRVIDLKARWQEDVLEHAPDWLSIMIGINDVWRHFDGDPGMEQVDPERYETVYRELLQRTRPRVEGLIVMSPFFLESHLDDAMRTMMDAYGAIARRLAGECDAIFVDVQAAFDAFLAHQPAEALCADRVHPNGVGHMIIARAFLQAIGA
ncbi:MAG: SGNH/GDSL hydrolase family protein [Opitutales bacterium]